MIAASSQTKKFAIVTGASSGMGYELTLRCAEEGFDSKITTC